jgi:short-subunit dehydrogenase involved in D-alanine esterification of teichoic acids
MSSSESLRIQLAGADTGVQVIEVVPPAESHRTPANGQVSRLPHIAAVYG